MPGRLPPRPGRPGGLGYSSPRAGPSAESDPGLSRGHGPRWARASARSGCSLRRRRRLQGSGGGPRGSLRLRAAARRGARGCLRVGRRGCPRAPRCARGWAWRVAASVGPAPREPFKAGMGRRGIWCSMVPPVCGKVPAGPLFCIAGGCCNG